jgi:hypothetical protein
MNLGLLAASRHPDELKAMIERRGRELRTLFNRLTAPY